MKPFAVLLASHGNYAREAMYSAEMIIGRQENVRVFSIDMEKSIPDAKEEFDQLIDELDAENGILILTDIVGGTPSNLATEKLLADNNIHVLAGFHMPVLLELFSGSRFNLVDTIRKLKKVYLESFVDLNERLIKTPDEDSL